MFAASRKAVRPVRERSAERKETIMSRIHDALRKAEEEKLAGAVRVGTAPAAQPVAPCDADDPSPFEMPAMVHESALRQSRPRFMKPAVPHEPDPLPMSQFHSRCPAAFRNSFRCRSRRSRGRTRTCSSRCCRLHEVVLPSATPKRIVRTPTSLSSWEMIASRCPQRAWKPTKGMLFLNGNIHDQVGTEEFRTLRSRLYHVREKRPLKDDPGGQRVTGGRKDVRIGEPGANAGPAARPACGPAGLRSAPLAPA